MQQSLSERFQYKSLPFEPQVLQESRLNELGSQGWNLVATFPHIIFARRVAEAGQTIQADVPLLLSIKQAAARLGMSRSKVYGLIAAGEIVCFRHGRSVRVPRQELEIFIRQNRH